MNYQSIDDLQAAMIVSSSIITTIEHSLHADRLVNDDVFALMFRQY